MKGIKILFVCFLMIVGFNSYAQDSTGVTQKLMYHPELDAKKQIADAVKEAKQSNKQILLMVGGNWCRWCRMFQKFIDSDASLDSIVKADYVMEHINYSKENKNAEVLKQLEYPQRFGYPVFVILDKDGKRIHTQNSGYLEEGEGYNKEKTMEFFSQWSVSALDPKQYLDK